MRRIISAVIPLSVVLTACSGLPDMPSVGANRSGADPTNPDSVTIADRPPGSDYRSLGKVSGYARGNCKGPQATQQRSEAVDNLRKRAAADGADYVRVNGSGTIADRGVCTTDDVYRITGTAYTKANKTETTNPDTAAQSADDSPASKTDNATRSAPDNNGDNLEGNTADKLKKLESLRRQGLITEAEYERLRERVLDEAF